MAKMTLPSDASAQPFLPAGIYGVNEPVRIQQASVDFVERDATDGPRYLNIRVGIPSKEGLVFVRTNGKFRDHTSFESNSGSKAEQFLRNLGFASPAGEGFDLDGLPGMEVTVEVGHRTYVNKDGETRNTNWIRNISRR